MLGQPIYMLIPEVIGFKLTGELAEGATATDLVLTVTQMLRKRGVVGKFVEFYGPGLDGMSLPDRATIANMAPEYGATMGFFPIDDQTIKYMRRTGRSDALCETVEHYCRRQGLWRSEQDEIEYTDTLELDISQVLQHVHHRAQFPCMISISEVCRIVLAVLLARISSHGSVLRIGDEVAGFVLELGVESIIGDVHVHRRIQDDIFDLLHPFREGTYALKFSVILTDIRF